MTMQQCPGEGPLLWYPPYASVSPPAFVNATCNASGNQIAIIGRLFLPNRGTKSIRKIHVRAGTIVSAGGSTGRFSIQGASLAAAPIQADGTIANSGNAACTFNVNTMTTNTWFISPAFTADQSQTHGDLFAAVFDFTSYSGSDSVQISSLQGIGSSQNCLQCNTVTQTSGTWAVTTAIPNIIFEMSDGTFGTFRGAIPFSATSSTVVNSTTEVGLPIQLPYACKTDGILIPMSVGTSAVSTANLYSGTTLLASATIDNHQVSVLGAARLLFLPWSSEISLSANTQYYLSAAYSSGATNSTVYYFTVYDANHLSCHPGGVNCNYTTRNGGAWASPTTTQRLIAGLSISSIDDGAGGGSTNNRVIGC